MPEVSVSDIFSWLQVMMGRNVFGSRTVATAHNKLDVWKRKALILLAPQWCCSKSSSRNLCFITDLNTKTVKQIAIYYNLALTLNIYMSMEPFDIAVLWLDYNLVLID